MASIFRFKGFSTQDMITNTGWTIYDLDLIKRDLLNVFNTRQGERVMMPTFGTIIWDKLFEPFTETVEQEIIDDVTRIVNSDPRTTVSSIQVSTTDHGITIYIDMIYAPWNVIGSFEVDFNKRSEEF